jgi:hypothetical protein
LTTPWVAFSSTYEHTFDAARPGHNFLSAATLDRQLVAKLLESDRLIAARAYSARAQPAHERPALAALHAEQTEIAGRALIDRSRLLRAPGGRLGHAHGRRLVTSTP